VRSHFTNAPAWTQIGQTVAQIENGTGQ
jgi:hypothetical protein